MTHGSDGEHLSLSGTECGVLLHAFKFIPVAILFTLEIQFLVGGLLYI
jgi:hypothetical protein